VAGAIQAGQRHHERGRHAAGGAGRPSGVRPSAREEASGRCEAFR
jgi:hypothetical protein